MRVTNVHQLNKQTNQANSMMNHAQTHTHRPFDHSGQMRKPQQCTRIELCIFSSINTKYDNHIYRRIFKFRWNIINLLSPFFWNFLSCFTQFAYQINRPLPEIFFTEQWWNNYACGGEKWITIDHATWSMLEWRYFRWIILSMWIFRNIGWKIRLSSFNFKLKIAHLSFLRFCLLNRF